MGRVGNASPHHHGGGVEFQEIHQSPTADTFGDAHPPPPEEDLYEPPPDYQPPPPAVNDKPPPPPPQVQSFPPPQYNEPQPFPPPQNDLTPPPMAAQPFPPPQQQKPQPFPPNQYIHNQNFPQQQTNLPPQQGIPLFVQPSPVLMPQLQQNLPWKTHLFDCMKDPRNAIITLCFPCVTFGQIAEILDNGSPSCATSGIVYTCIALWIGMPCLMSCGYRSKLRAKFGLVESPAPDCLIHCFCGYCALCQEYRELNERGFDPSIGHAGNLAKQQRQQQFGMTPPMNQRMMM